MVFDDAAEAVVKETLARIEGKKSSVSFSGSLVLWGDRVVEVSPSLGFMKRWHRITVREHCRRMRWKIEVIHELERRP